MARAASKKFLKALQDSRVPTQKVDVPPKRPIKFRKEWEAEELRRGIENLCENADRSADIDRDELCIPVADLERLLEMVDARDSLAYLEAKTKKSVTRSLGRERQKKKRC
jgi:hypothetical protein